MPATAIAQPAEASLPLESTFVHSKHAERAKAHKATGRQSPFAFNWAARHAARAATGSSGSSVGQNNLFSVSAIDVPAILWPGFCNLRLSLKSRFEFWDGRAAAGRKRTDRAIRGRTAAFLGGPAHRAWDELGEAGGEERSLAWQGPCKFDRRSRIASI